VFTVGYADYKGVHTSRTTTQD